MKIFNHREEGQKRRNGISLFHYHSEKRISGIELNTNMGIITLRWNRPSNLPPLFTMKKISNEISCS